MNPTRHSVPEAASGAAAGASAASGATPEAASAAVAATYQANRERALAEAARWEGQAGLLGLLRFAAFAAAFLAASAAIAGWPVGFAAARPVAAVSTAALLAAFVALVMRHAAVLNHRDRARQLAAVNRLGLARLDGSWATSPVGADTVAATDAVVGAGAAPVATPETAAASAAAPVALPPYAEDLDLVGQASLLHLIDTTHTRFGAAALLRALSHAAAPEPDVAPVHARQEAVRELAGMLDLRQHLEVSGRLLNRTEDDVVADPVLGKPRPRSTARRQPDPEPLLRWAEGPRLLCDRLPIAPWLRLLPLLTLPVCLAVLLRPSPGLELLAYLLLGIQLLTFALTLPRIQEILSQVESGENALSAYGDMLTLLSEARFQTATNGALRDAVRLHDESPARGLRRLQSAYGQLELRRNPLLWLPMNALLLWDLFFAVRIERWQASLGPRLRGWLVALGELEARCALATLAHENPGWTYPEITAAPPRFQAEDLGHPLIHRTVRVGNDVTLPGPGQGLLITGSNMSGKSTLLRSIGLAQVLAQAGAPVCARRARLSPFTLRTVMRVRDDLSQGVSHFYAELRRLKETVDAVAGGGPPLCYLLDEILHGTNTRERELGARAVVKTLCRRGALGAVSTHDLSLASLEAETGGAVRNVHFTEILDEGGGDRMRFDYRLRQGPVETTNALRLMRLCGIALDWDGIDESGAQPR